MSKFLVLAGDGLNCQKETRDALVLAGGSADIIHINELLSYPQKLRNYQGLAIPGGFSFGDDLGSGKILSLKLQQYLQDELQTFLISKRPIIGICNGLQVLVKLGLLPFPFAQQNITLTLNEQKEFINKWVSLTVNPHSPCIWTRKVIKGLQEQSLMLPIRHAEGAFVIRENNNFSIYNQLIEKGQIVLRYDHNINGSSHEIAGICDETGLILGMMPHPEAYVSNLLHPYLSQDPKSKYQKGAGLLFFESAVDYLKEC